MVIYGSVIVYSNTFIPLDTEDAHQQDSDIANEDLLLRIRFCMKWMSITIHKIHPNLFNDFELFRNIILHILLSRAPKVDHEFRENKRVHQDWYILMACDILNDLIELLIELTQ